jgi:hypothetical protein
MIFNGGANACCQWTLRIELTNGEDLLPLRYLDYHAKKRETRLHALCDEVRQVMYSLHAQGDYPSAWLVAKLLRTGDAFRDSVVLTTWRETLLELDLRQ